MEKTKSIVFLSLFRQWFQFIYDCYTLVASLVDMVGDFITLFLTSLPQYPRSLFYNSTMVAIVASDFFILVIATQVVVRVMEEA